MDEIDKLLFSNISLDNSDFFYGQSNIIQKVDKNKYLNPYFTKNWLSDGSIIIYENDLMSYEDQNDFYAHKQQKELINDIEEESKVIDPEMFEQYEEVSVGDEQIFNLEFLLEKFDITPFEEVQLLDKTENFIVSYDDLELVSNNQKNFEIQINNQAHILKFQFFMQKFSLLTIVNSNLQITTLLPIIAHIQLTKSNNICNLFCEDLAVNFEISEQQFPIFLYFISACNSLIQTTESYQDEIFSLVNNQIDSQENFNLVQVSVFQTLLLYKLNNNLQSLQNSFNQLTLEDKHIFTTILSKYPSFAIHLNNNTLTHTTQKENLHEFSLLLISTSETIQKQICTLNNLNINISSNHFKLFISLLPEIINLPEINFKQMPKICYQILYILRKLTEDEEFSQFEIFQPNLKGSIYLVGKAEKLNFSTFQEKIIQKFEFSIPNLTIFDPKTRLISQFDYSELAKNNNFLSVLTADLRRKNKLFLEEISESFFEKPFPGTGKQSSKQFYVSQGHFDGLYRRYEMEGLGSLFLLNSELEMIYNVKNVEFEAVFCDEEDYYGVCMCNEDMEIVDEYFNLDLNSQYIDIL